MQIILFPLKVAKHIKLELAAWIKLLVRAWPEGPLGHRLRWTYWQRVAKLAGLGNVARMADIVHPQTTTVGKDFICSDYTVVNSKDSLGIYIGDHVMLGPRVYIRAADHNFADADTLTKEQGHACAALRYGEKNYSVIIEDNVWVGANTIILSGAKIGKGAIIGAGSVVTREIPPNAIAVGSPARVVRMRG